MTNKRFSSLLRGGKKTFGQVTSSVSEATSDASNHASKQKLKIPDDELRGIQVLPEYLAVKDLINENFPLIFVTGGAGTGKSTFIRWLDKRRDSDINDSSIGETCFDNSARGTRGGSGKLNAVAT